MTKWLLFTAAFCLVFYSLCAQPAGAEQKGDPNAPVGRAVSLGMLQRQLDACQTEEGCPRDLLTLIGMTRLLGYVLDDASNDLILVGEANSANPPLYVEDLAIALKNANLDYGELKGNTYFYSHPGCSIDPDPQMLSKLRKVSEDIAAGDSEKEIKRSIEDWHSTCRSPQAVRVVGVPFNTRFARVMVKADYDMKTLADGSDSLDIPGFTSLTDRTLEKARSDVLAGRPTSVGAALNRFWFYPGDVNFAEDEGIALINECQVQLLTEEEFQTSKGEIVGTGRANPDAEEFARCLTSHYEEVAARRPIYKELENLFRHVALAKLLKSKGFIGGAGQELNFLLERFRIPDTAVDSTLPGRSNVKGFSHRQDYANGYRIARAWIPVCGGVSMEFEISQSDIRRDATGRLAELRRRILRARSSPDTVSWNFSLE